MATYADQSWRFSALVSPMLSHNQKRSKTERDDRSSQFHVTLNSSQSYHDFRQFQPISQSNLILPFLSARYATNHIHHFSNMPSKLKNDWDFTLIFPIPLRMAWTAFHSAPPHHSVHILTPRTIPQLSIIPFPEFSLDLPDYNYRSSKQPTVPLDRLRTNNCHFDTLEEALLYICQHCIEHYGFFSRSMALTYIADCSIYDTVHNDYVSYVNVPVQTVTTAFNAMSGRISE